MISTVIWLTESDAMARELLARENLFYGSSFWCVFVEFSERERLKNGSLRV